MTSDGSGGREHQLLREYIRDWFENDTNEDIPIATVREILLALAKAVKSGQMMPLERWDSKQRLLDWFDEQPKS